MDTEVFLLSLRETISTDDLKIWFGDFSIKILKKNQYQISSSSQMRLEKIKDCFSNELLTTISKVFKINKENLQLFFKHDPSHTPISIDTLNNSPTINTLSSNIPVNSKKSSMEYSSRLLPHLTLNRYVRSEFNQIAFDLAQKVTEKIGLIHPFYIHSKVGMGKTHLLHSIGNYYQEKFPFLKILYMHPNEFVEEYVQSIFSKTTRQFRIKYKSVDILLIDDIQFFMGKEKSSIEFFHLFNEIYTPEKQLVFCSDRPPHELDQIDDRLKSRLSSSVITEIEDLKEIDKKHLLDFYLAENNTTLSKDIYSFILKYLPNDVRIITGIVKSVVIYQEIYQKKLTVEFIKSNIKHLSIHPQNIYYDPQDILKLVCDYSKISISEIKSPKKNKMISFYRHITMYLLKTKLSLSLTEIAQILGGKNVSSVYNGIKNIEEKKKLDPSLNEIVHHILKT